MCEQGVALKSYPMACKVLAKRFNFKKVYSKRLNKMLDKFESKKNLVYQ